MRPFHISERRLQCVLAVGTASRFTTRQNGRVRMSDPLRIQFDAGTLILSSAPDALLESLPGCRFDERTAAFRTEARHYRAIVETLRVQQIAFTDDARNFQ